VQDTGQCTHVLVAVHTSTLSMVSIDMHLYCRALHRLKFVLSFYCRLDESLIKEHALAATAMLKSNEEVINANYSDAVPQSPSRHSSGESGVAANRRNSQPSS
jgi:hypothetical protein